MSTITTTVTLLGGLATMLGVVMLAWHNWRQLNANKPQILAETDLLKQTRLQNEINHAIASQAKALDAVNAVLTSVNIQVDRLDTDLTETTTELLNCVQRCKKLETENEDLKTQLKLLSANTGEVHILKQRLNSVENQLQDAWEQCAQLEKRNTVLTDHIHALEAWINRRMNVNDLDRPPQLVLN